jgi:hypothetical protein
MPPTNRISGKKSGGKVNGTTISGVYSYNAEEVADELDASVGSADADEAAVTRTDTGKTTLTVSFSCFFDLAEAVVGTFRAGSWVENLAIWDELDSVPVVEMDYGKVTRLVKKGEVRGRLEYEFTVKNWGPYTYTESPG